MLQEKIERPRSFWTGTGPCLILNPAFAGLQYDTENYPER